MTRHLTDEEIEMLNAAVDKLSDIYSEVNQRLLMHLASHMFVNCVMARLGVSELPDSVRIELQHELSELGVRFITRHLSSLN